MSHLKASIKQIKRGTYLDLSKHDISQESFIPEFSQFADEHCSFLNGVSVSIIFPERFSNDDEFNQILDKMKDELNKRNISLKNFEFGYPTKFIQAGSETEKQVSKEESPSPSSSNTNNEAIDYGAMENHEFIDHSALYLKTNLRSGQAVQHRGDVVVFGDVNPSAEIIASGDIVVWGTLRGIAHAGAEGNSKAMIAALNFNCGQLRISDKYTVINPTTNSRKKTTNCSPQIAKIVDNEIRVN